MPPLPFEVAEAFSKITRLPALDRNVFESMGFKLNCQKKYHIDKTLYLDLDGTLIHKMEKEIDYSNALIYKDCKKDIEVPDPELGTVKMTIIIRPYAQNFLKRLVDKYELIIYTASGVNYAKEVCYLLDPSKVYISQILSRGQCALIN